MANLVGRPWLLALVVGLLAAGAASLVSAHGGDPTQIHACVSQSGRGQVTIYSAPGLPGSDPAGTCGNQAYPLDWGTIGATGPSGVPGPAGSVSPGVYGTVSITNSTAVFHNASIGFDSFGPAAGVTPIGTNTNNSGFRILSDGVYRVRATCGTASFSQPLVIQRSGTTQPAGTFYTGADPIPCGTGEVVLQLNGGDFVQLVNPGNPFNLYAPTGGVAASMDIVKLS